MSLSASAPTPALEKAVFGGGCFWCIESIFDQIKGVAHAVSGYAGGKEENPTYKQVCSGATGHAEVIEVTFDPEIIAYAILVNIFFAIHDPTTLNRQGSDAGPQYRSIILYQSDIQKTAAEKVIKQVEAEKIFDNPVVTQIEKLEKFWPAEDYHQNYFRQNASQPYCQFVISPKVSKFRKKFSHLLKK